MSNNTPKNTTALVANAPVAPVATAPVAPTVAIAPQHPMGQGKSTAGGHVKAWRAQPDFGLALPITLPVAATNRWRPGTHGHAFWAAVLAEPTAPATIADLIAIGAKVRLTPPQIMGHIRWLYTWQVGFAVGGAQWPEQPVATAPAAVATAPVVAPLAPPAPVAPASAKAASKAAKATRKAAKATAKATA
jgi:hypothetical protein